MKIKIFILITLMSVLGYGQKTKNYFVAKKGDTVDVYQNIKGESYVKYNTHFSGHYALTDQFLWYHDENGKLQKIGQGKLTEAHLFGNYYTSLKIGSMFGFNRLHEIIIENSDYILSKFYSHGYYYVYLLDKQKEKFVFKKEKIYKKKDEKLFRKKILPYFNDCYNFLEKVEYNLKYQYQMKSFFVKSYLFKGLTNLSCN